MAGINRTTGKATDLITFSRSSRGTALRKISYGSELVGPVDFTTWETSVNISGTTASTFTNSGTAYIWKNLGLITGSVYAATVTLDTVAGSSTIAYTGTDTTYTSASAISDSAETTFVFVAAGPDFGFRVSLASGTTTDLAGNISVKEVLFDQPDGTLTLFNHPNNIPRIEYAADGTVKGLLIEESRTNLVTYSEAFDNAAWTKSNILPFGSGSVANDAIAPDGETTAEMLVPNTTNTFHNVSQTKTNSSGTHTLSVFAKANGYNWLRLNFVGSSGECFFDLQNEMVGVAGSDAKIENFGNGWYRCSMTSAASANTTVAINVANADGSSTFAGDGASGILIWGAQVEAGSFPTSYMPSSGSPATRAADLASISVDSFGYRQDAGTVVVESSSLAAVAGDFNSIVVVGTNFSNRINLGQINDDGYQVISEGGVTSVIYNEGSAHNKDRYPANVQKKTGIAFSSSSAVAGLDGQIGAEDTSVVVPAATEMRVGYDYADRYRNGHIKSIAYYPRRLSNAQLQELTA